MTHPVQRFCLELREMLAAATPKPWNDDMECSAGGVWIDARKVEKMLAVIEAAAAAITDSPPFEYGYAHYDALAKALAALGQP